MTAVAFVEDRPATLPPGLPQRRWRMPAGAGQGWAQTHQLGNGVVLGRLSCQFEQHYKSSFECHSDSLRLMLMLQGGQRVRSARGEVQALAGDVLVRHGNPGPLCSEVPAHMPLASIALDVPRPLLAELRADARLPLAHLGPPGRCTLLRPASGMARTLADTGWRLLALGRAPSPLAQLELQALGLGLLHQLLMADAHTLPGPISRRWQRALDEALRILHTEWNQPLTIAALARRAGMNECYLKEMFRQRTGQTVAAYLRALRMAHARRLLESGQATVQQAAHACGYARADKFAQAFRREHGLLPSQLAQARPCQPLCA